MVKMKKWEIGVIVIWVRIRCASLKTKGRKGNGKWGAGLTGENKGTQPLGGLPPACTQLRPRNAIGHQPVRPGQDFTDAARLGVICKLR